MIQLGKKQKLQVLKKVDFGVYLGESMQTDVKEKVLLPIKQVPEQTKEGDILEVFIYKDSMDRMIATVREPDLQVGETAVLKVVQTSKIGAFLDWGLEKDLLLPFREQTMRVKEGQECLVALYIDKSERLCATMKVYPYLSLRTPYGMNDEVQGRVYEISERFGVFVAVDDHYCAMVPKREAQGKFRIGEVRKFRVTEVKEDGKMNLSAHQKAYLQIGEDAKLVRKVIDEFAGVLPFDDKVSPQVIEREFGLSKNAFKRAVGHMLKNGEIEIRDGRIYRRD
ncbi:S1 RNA-binding domain-containing protein [Blautia hydrogenotrophica]|uniref:CvfB family protein n=1 Tax=Blautia hydrogenotrophica TaxID=53443 RepID=UPI002E79BA7A|nr:S1-like domain-containing RNA-binding protein [Blautia hydrogenotrophica]MEE0461663.1 S1-like domain-containing RNA-binding protein [Blautia hydrogenotrophica]